MAQKGSGYPDNESFGSSDGGRPKSSSEIAGPSRAEQPPSNAAVSYISCSFPNLDNLVFLHFLFD